MLTHTQCPGSPFLHRHCSGRRTQGVCLGCSLELELTRKKGLVGGGGVDNGNLWNGRRKHTEHAQDTDARLKTLLKNYKCPVGKGGVSPSEV